MRLARPSILWRALTLDLWKLLLLTAAVVVSVGVFALVLRPLADGRIGPEEALKFMGFGILPMLQYALPFAAGFGATLAYHRLATDNELIACHAGGISHRTMLVPAGATGVVLAGVLLVLADFAIPRLLRSMEELLSQDVVRLIIAPIKRGEAIQFGKVQVYADDVAAPPPDVEAGAERYVLSGVLAVELDDKGLVVREASARTAYVWIYRTAEGGGVVVPDSGTRGSGTTVVLRLQDAAMQIKDPGLKEVEDSTFVYRIPNLFDDDPKFFSWSQLEEAKRRPERMNWIDRQKRTVAGLLHERVLVESISAQLATSGAARFTDPAGRAVVVKARRLGENAGPKGWSIESGAAASADPRAVEVTTDLGEGRTRVQRARRAWLAAPADESSPPGTVIIRMEDVAGGGTLAPTPGGSGETTTILEPGAGQLKEWSLSALTPAEAPPPESASRSIADLLTDARKAGARAAAPNPRLAKAAETLAIQVADLGREILSKQQERLAASVACLVMVLCGAVMAMRLRDSLPLAVYLWSFLPALGTLLTISGGQRMTHQNGLPGLLLLWGGVGGLALYTFIEYRRVARR